MEFNRTATALITGPAALALALAGCPSDDNTTAEVTESATPTATEATSEMEKSDAVVQPTDAYIKKRPTDKDMTAIFGTLTNNTDKGTKVSSFKPEGLKEGMKSEQHDIRDGRMFKVLEGLTILASDELILEPGSTHFTIVDNDETVNVGTEYRLVIEFSSDSSITQGVEVRVQPAGEEDYGNGDDPNDPEHMDGGEMDHSGH